MVQVPNCGLVTGNIPMTTKGPIHFLDTIDEFERALHYETLKFKAGRVEKVLFATQLLTSEEVEPTFSNRRPPRCKRGALPAELAEERAVQKPVG